MPRVAGRALVENEVGAAGALVARVVQVDAQPALLAGSVRSGVAQHGDAYVVSVG